MTDPCVHLDDYVDGELAPSDRAAFERHLATCPACAADLPRLLALMSALDAAAQPTTDARPGPRLTVVRGATAATATRPAGGACPPEAPRPGAAAVPARPQRRARWIAASALAAAAAAAIAVLVVRPPAPSAPPVVASLDDQLGPTRHLEARLSYAGTERYRPLDAARGAASSEPISIDRMGQFERARDWHGVAVAALLAGERERAQRFFAQAPTTPAVDSDRAALELADGSRDALERALDDVDRALQAAPHSPAARWNRALVLAGLDLPLAAARELDDVIATGEAGWADEARRRAAALRAGVEQRRTRFHKALVAGKQLIEDGAPIPAELIGVTGFMTITLYDAVRAARSREAVEALVPLAQSLDRLYRSDRLTAHVRRIAASDFRVRKPLAEIYRAWVLTGTLPGPAIASFLARVAPPATDDLWMGAAVRAGDTASRLDDYRRRAARSGDPWFLAIAEHEAAKAEIARGELTAAERRLREAIAAARRDHLDYRAIALEDELVELLISTRRPSPAAAAAEIAYRETIASGDYIRELNAISELAAINVQRYSSGLARAYLTEQIERSNSRPASPSNPNDEPYDCTRRQYAYQELASLALGRFDPEGARAELARAPRCDDPHVELAMQRTFILRDTLIRALLYYHDHSEQDASLARDGLARLRQAPQASIGELAFRSYVEGLLTLETSRAAGRRALRDAVAQAGHHTDDVSIKARAYSLALLAMDAARASEFGDVIAIVAETLEVARPERCAVAIAMHEDRSVVAVLDSRGQPGGQYVTGRSTADVDAQTLIPASIIDRLRPCERVKVLVRPPTLGMSRLLPPYIAWSYVLKDSAVTAAPRIGPGSARLVVANPLPPPDLNVPALGPYPDAPDEPATVILRGGDATPTKVLAAMLHASIIEFHTHGFIANDVSESSYLALSPELNRQYAMTASDVAQVTLDATPLVILGACHAATSSRSLEGGMGLAEAFLRAGARAAIASPGIVQDLSAPAVFAAIRDRVIHGSDPATAVRDERVRRLAEHPDATWILGIVVFE